MVANHQEDIRMSLSTSRPSIKFLKIKLSSLTPVTLIFLGIILFFLLFLAVGAPFRSPTVVTLDILENRFKLNFEVAKNDQAPLSKALEQLGLPQSIKEGVEFELDATSSAKLAMLTPIKANLDFSSGKIKFNGSLHTSFLKEIVMEEFKLPKSTNLAIFAPSFGEFLKVKFHLPPEFHKWLDENLKEEGQYLVFLGERADFAIIFKSETADFEGLKNIRIEGEEFPYKVESGEDIDFHLLKLREVQDQEPQTFTFFQIGNWVFMGSSYEASQKLIEAQRSPASQAFIFKAPTAKPISLFISFQNEKKDMISEEFQDFLLPQAAQLAQVAEKIENFEFILKGKDFSGLIEVE